MSDDLFNDVYDDDAQAPSQQNGGPKALRDAYEAEKTARRELEQRLAALETETRQTKLADTLKASGVDPRVAGLVPKDIAPDKVGDWIATYGDLFGAKTAAQEPQSGVDADSAAALAAVSGEPTGSTTTTSAVDADSLRGIDNEADFWKTIRS